MKHKKVAMFLVLLVVALGFVDILVTLPVIDDSNIIELNSFIKTSSQLLTFGVPLQVFLSVGFFIFYYQIWVKNWLEEEHPKAELAFLAGFSLLFLFKCVCVANNLIQLHIMEII